jgi:hypothetical protein
VIGEENSILAEIMRHIAITASAFPSYLKSPDRQRQISFPTMSYCPIFIGVTQLQHKKRSYRLNVDQLSTFARNI